MILVVPLRTPSGNQLSGRHWRTRVKLRKLWALAIRVAMTQAKVYGRPEFRRVRVTFVREAALPIKDTDNAYAGLKPVLDAMVEIGLLLDDSQAVVEELVLRQVKAPRAAERTVIELEDLRAPPGSSSPT